MLSLILLVFAFVLTLIAAFWQPGAAGWRTQLGWLGLSLYFLSLLLANAKLLHW